MAEAKTARENPREEGPGQGRRKSRRRERDGGQCQGPQAHTKHAEAARSA